MASFAYAFASWAFRLSAAIFIRSSFEEMLVILAVVDTPAVPQRSQKRCEIVFETNKHEKNNANLFFLS